MRGRLNLLLTTSILEVIGALEVIISERTPVIRFGLMKIIGLASVLFFQSAGKASNKSYNLPRSLVAVGVTAVPLVKILFKIPSVASAKT